MTEEPKERSNVFRKGLHYLRKEVDNQAFDYVWLYLKNDIEDANESNRDSLLNYVQDTDPNLFCRILIGMMQQSEMFLFDVQSFLENVRPSGLLIALEYSETTIEDSQGINREQLLDTYYQLFISFLLSANMLRADEEFPQESYEKRVSFLERNGLDSDMASILTRLPSTYTAISDVESLLDFGIESMGPIIKIVKKSIHPFSEDTFIDAQIPMIKHLLGIRRFDKAIELTKKLLDAFPGNRIIERWYLLSLIQDKKHNDVLQYIHDHYSDAQIDEDPELLVFLGNKHQMDGNLAKALECMRKAYEISEKDNLFFFSYVLVLLKSDKIDEARAFVGSHFETLSRPFTPFILLLLATIFLEHDISISERFLDQYQRTYPEELDNLHTCSPLAENFSYLQVKARLEFEKKNYRDFLETMESVLQIDRDYPWAHFTLALSLSNKRLNDIFNPEKAQEHAMMFADTTETSPKGILGLIRLGSEDWEEGAKLLEEALEEEKGLKSLHRDEIHRCLSIAYFGLDNPEKSCYHAEQWLNEFDEWKRLKTFSRHSSISMIGAHRADQAYVRFISAHCPEIAHRVEYILDKWKAWHQVSEMSFEIHAREDDIRMLRQRIRELEDKLADAKSSYRSIEVTDEEQLEPLIEEILAIERARIHFQQEISSTTWTGIGDLLDEKLPRWNRLPLDIKTFLQSAEFSLKINPSEADFSGPILYYAKTFEAILHEMITKPFVEEIESQFREEVKDWRLLSPPLRIVFNSAKRGSITLGQWAVFMKLSNDNIHEYDKRFRSHIEEVLAPIECKTIQKHANRLYKFRNGSAHISRFSKDDAVKAMSQFRKALGDLLEIFYPNNVSDEVTE